jgi:hypothetical protein
MPCCSISTDVAQTEWIGEFSAIHRQDFITLEKMRSMMESMSMNLNPSAQPSGIAMTEKTIE